MEFVVSESRRPRKWYYFDKEYYSKEGDNIVAKIAGCELVSPDVICARRKAVRATLPLNARGLYRVTPDPVTVALWQDWQNRKNEDC